MATLWQATANWIAANPVSLGATNLTTLQKTDEQTTNEHVWLGYLVNPATGSQTLAWNWGTAPTDGANIAVVFYKGVVTSNPVVSSGQQLTDQADLTGLIAGPDDMMVGAVGTWASAPTVTDSGQTQLAVTTLFNTNYGGFAEKLGGTGFYFTDAGGNDTTCAAAVFRGGSSYSNTNSITIPDSGSATPYPSTITVPALSGTVTKVTVTLTGLTHTYPDDVRILLVGPQGQDVLLMYYQGAGNAVTGVNLTFDDGAASQLPDSQITSGTYRPCSDTQNDDMNAPAPARPYGTTMSVFNGVDPQGTWSLYVLDYAANDAGSISGGWELTLDGVSAGGQIGASLVTSITTSTDGGWQFVNKGTGAAADNAASVTAALPAGTQLGDLLVIIAYARNGSTRTPDLPAGWAEAARYDGASTNGEIAVFYKVHDGSEADTVVNFSGAGSAGCNEMVQMAAFRGNDPSQASVLGNVGADSSWATAQNVGPITAVTLTNANQLLLVMAGRIQDMGTNGISNVVSTLTGDSQTWVEIEERGTTLGNNAGYVWDYAFTSGTPAITNKTFTNTDTQTAAGVGMMVAFKMAVNSYSFPSATYSNNVLYIAYTATSCTSGSPCDGTTGAPRVTGVSGAGLTFTEIGTPGGLPFSSGNRRIQAWRALVTSGATTGAVTITLDGASYSMGAAMIQFTGTKTSGTNGADAVVQWPSLDGGSTASHTVTMNAFADSNNRPVAFFAHRTAQTTYNEAGYTELYEGMDSSTPVMAYEAEWHAATAETTPNVTWDTASGSGGFALEIAAASAPEVTVSTSGTQTASMLIPSTNQYVGGKFVIVNNTGSRNVTGITITESGTVDALNNLDNIKLFYELDTTAPYDGASENFAGTESQFGSTDTDGFSAANGTSSFTGSVGISTTAAMVVYVVLDVGAGATNGQTVEISINNPSTDVTVSAGTVEPATAVAISGTTTLSIPPANLDQIHYRWRNNDGPEVNIRVNSGHTVYTSAGVQTNHVINTPSHSPGDVIYIAFACDLVQTITWPAGFTGGQDDIEATATWGVAYKVAGASEPATYTVSIGTTERAVAIAWSVSNDGGVDASSTFNGGSSATATCNAATTTQANDLVFRFVATDNSVASVTHSTLADYTMLGQVTYNSGASLSVQYATKASIGSTGTADVTITSEQWGSATMAIRQAAGPPPATWAANEDTKLTGLAKSTPRRVRFEVSNEGGASSGGVTYQLEVAQTATCSSGAYSAVPTGATGHWQIVGSSYITDGEATTDIIGGLTDESTTFVAGQLKDAGNTTGSITLAADAFTEIEFAVQATTNAVDGANYCFRLTNSGAALNTYTTYAEATLAGGAANLDQIHYRWRNDDGGETGTAVIAVDTASENYTTGGSSITISHTVSGADRLMLVGVSIVNGALETVGSVTWKGTESLSPVGTVTNVDDSRVEIWSLVAPSTGTGNVVVSFGGAISQSAVAGVVTFTGVHQSTPLGTFASAIGDASTPATVPVSSAAGELVFGVVCAEYGAVTTDPSQTQHWNRSIAGSGSTNAAGSTEAGAAPTVTTSWGVGSTATNHWAVGGVSIKPASGSGATWAANEDTKLTGLAKSTLRRVRFEVSNEGASSSGGITYRLEVAQTATCSSGTYAAVPTGATDHWQIVGSTYITDGQATANVAGGLTDESATFVAGQLKDAGNTTGSITLASNEFTEIEFAVQATTNATDGANYCFRLYNTTGGTVLNTYTRYAEATVAGGAGPPPAPVATAASAIQPTSFLANWNASSGADGYVLDVATDSGFTSFVPEYDGLDVGNLVTYSVANWAIYPGTTYYYRVRAYNGNGSSGNSNTINVTTLDAVTLGNHTLWQVTSRFTAASPVTDVFFRFNLRRSTVTTVTAVRVNFTVASGVANGDVTGGALYRDNNNDGEVDGLDTALVTGVAGSGGQLAFTSLTEDPGAGGTHYLVRATVANLVVGDSTTFSMGTADVDSSLPKVGSITSVTHTRIAVSSLYRSVGTNANDLNAGGPTVQISGTLATFSGPMPTNVGVGDALTYNSGGAQLAFVHGRTSSTIFTVLNKNGGTPTAAPALTAVGVYRAYTSLANWQSQTENANIAEPVEDDVNPAKDLVSANAVLNVACYGDGADNTNRVTIDGWTTGATTYINIFTPYLPSDVGVPQRHGGKWDSAKYHLVRSVTYNGVLTISDEYVRIEGLQVENSAGTASKDCQENAVRIASVTAASEIRISDTILRATSLGSSCSDGDIQGAAAIRQNTSTGVVKGWNNIMYGWGSGFTQDWISNGGVTLYNNTIVDSVARGISLGGENVGSYRLANNLVQGASSDYVIDVGLTLDYSATNLSDDATSPQVALRDKTVAFVDAPNRDFHLAVGDSNAMNQGTSLSSDANLAFSDDIDGNSRPYGTAWDIGADEYQTGLFAYRRQITIGDTITPASCTSDLSDFPVLVKVTNADLMSASNGGHVESASGFDIIFRALDGTTQLDHEIESYDGSTGAVVAWVRIPTLVYNADTTIYMYYGNSGIAFPTANPAAVWGTSYKGVWHLTESGNGTAAEYNDSSQYANEGQGGRGNPLYVPARTAGQIGYGQDFDNADGKYDLVDVGNGSALNITGNQITLEAWVRHNVSAPYAHDSWGFVNRKGWSNGYRLLMQTSGYGCAPLCVHFDLGGGSNFLGTATLLTAGSWHHVVGTYDGSLARVFIDGVQDANTLSKTADLTAPPPPEDHVWIGHGDQPTDVGWSSEWDGQIDEVRVSNVARSACWIQTQYSNQSTVTDVNLGGEQVVDSTYAYHQAITIANAMTPASCTSNLSNFPVLVDTTNWPTADKNPLRTVANGGHVQSPTYYDLVFRDTAGLQLDHEIEKYDGATGTLVAWVRIPSLNPNGDTTIYVYYGNSAISTSTANPSGVWNTANGWRGVWHLKETSGQHVDSTSYNNDSTSVTVATQGSAAGKIDGADDFTLVSAQNVRVADSTSLDIGDAITLSAWVDPSTTSGTDKLRIVTKDAAAGSESYVLRVYGVSGNDGLEGYVNEAGTLRYAKKDTIITTGYQHVALTWDRIAGDHKLRLYRNGAEITGYTQQDTATSAMPASADDLYLGNNDALNESFGGRIDEVHISSVARNACWIETEYNNQGNPGTTVTPGGEQVDPSTFSHHQPITIANAMTPADCTSNVQNFPVLIDTTNWAAAYKDPLKTAPTGHVQSANGYDIVFRDSSDLQLDHEIEKYDGATGTLIAWVRVPTLSHNADTTIYMYYGNSLITLPTARPTEVWSTAYGWRGVWHLKENPAGSAPQMMDSTSNANNGTSQGGMTSGDQVPAQIDGGLDLDGGDDYIDAVNNGSSLNVGRVFTVGAWVKRRTIGAQTVITKAYSDQYTFKLSFTGSDYLRLDVNTGSGYNNVQGNTLTDTTSWHHVGAYSDGTNLKVFLDGLVHANSNSTPASVPYDSSNLLMGVGKWSSSPYFFDYFNGFIDEARVSSVPRDACWIGTEYNNQSTPGNVIPGGEQTDPAVYTSQRTITVRDVMTPASCSADLTSFPILIDTTNWTDKDDLKTVANGGSVQSSSGYDIIFRDASDTKLDHEVEKYDGAAGTLVAWVKIPTLAHNANTTITMYYGNKGVTSPTANPTGVWSNGFYEVWHLHETSGNHVDSTSNGYLGTPSGTITRGAAGQIDGADQLVGPSTATYVDLADGNFGNNQAFTVSAWFRVGTLTQWAGIVTKGREIHHDWVGLWENDEYRLSLGWDTATGYGNLDGSVLAAGQWYYGAGTFDGAQRNLYLNGSLNVGPSAGAYGGVTGSNTSIGNDRLNGVASSFDGIIDEVRISLGVARDACWVGTEYNSMKYAGDTNYILPGSEIVLATPTAVEMVSLDAVEVPGRGVLVSWRTGFEVDNLGFHVYREVGGERVRLTPSLVAGSALFAGAGTALTVGQSYSWWDASPVAGASYWLEEWELSGEKRWHGPVTVQPGVVSVQAQGLATAPSPLLAGLGQAVSPSPPQGVRRRLRQGVGSGPDRLAVQWGLASRPAVKLLVSEDGWYRVEQEELVRAGLDPSVDPGRLQLFADGRQVPFLVDAQQQGRFSTGDSLEFYGEGLDTPSTAMRVYWLVVGSGAGLRIPEAVGGGRWTPGPVSFPYEVERADRTLYFPALLNGEEGNFFGAVVTGTPVAQTVRVQHVNRSGQAELSVHLQGGTAGAHRVGVELNGVRVGTVVWDGMAEGEITVPLGTGMVLEGDNEVTLTAEGGEGDASAVESIRVRYAHTWEADGEALEFSLGGYQEVTIGGFRSPQVRVVDITDPGAVQALPVEVVEEGGGYRATVGVPESGTRTLLAVGTGAVRHPVGVLANRPTAWHAAGEGADLLIIAHRSLLSAVEPLRALRESQGLKVAVVDVESVYDEFSFGAKDPQAIKDLLACAINTWSRPPRYLLLVGDASYDPMSYLGYGYLDLVPTKLVDTTYLETASDDWFADFDADGIADIPVGRLPVQTLWEATTVVGKIVAYDGSAKLGRVLLVADANDTDNDFEALSGAIKAVLPSTVWAVEVYRGQLGDGAAKLQLMNGIDLGQTLINYIGHGSVAVWHTLLTSGEARALGNDRFGLVVSMTCLNGFFHDPFNASLAEAFLAAPAGGAVAVWASSGLTESEAQLPIDEALVRLLFSGTPITLGDATLAAKKAASDMDVRRTWILFGDPTTRLRR